MSQRKSLFRHFLVFLEGIMFYACWADQQLQHFGHYVWVVVDQVFPHSDVRLCKKTALPPNGVPVCPPGETDNDWSVLFVVFFFFHASELRTVA